MDVCRADERYSGGDPATGISSLHAFSFGPHYDPDNLRFGAVIACNEERLAPGAGFDEHPHSHTEIVTWVVEGELTHLDSAGHESVVRPGDVQRLSAGGGVRHVERNDGTEPLTFVQIWLAPLEPGGDPAYEVVHGIADSTPYAVPEAGAMLHVRRLTAGSGRRFRTPRMCTSTSYAAKFAWTARSWALATPPASRTRRTWRRWRGLRRRYWCGR